MQPVLGPMRRGVPRAASCCNGLERWRAAVRAGVGRELPCPTQERKRETLCKYGSRLHRQRVTEAAPTAVLLEMPGGACESLGSALCKTVKEGTADLAGRCKSAAAPFCIFRRDLEPRPREVPL